MLFVGVCSRVPPGTAFISKSTNKRRLCHNARTTRKHVAIQAHEGEEQSAAQRSLRSLDSLDLLLGSSTDIPADVLDAEATVAALAEPARQARQDEADLNKAVAGQEAEATPVSSAVSPEHLLELAMSRKLTLSVVKGTAKAQAQKWLDKKLKPKEHLLSVPGVDYHIMMAQPFLSYVVLGLNLSVYAAGLAVRFSMGESSGEDYFYMLAKVNDEVTHGEYYRLFTCAFLHDSFSHLALNTYALYTVAPQVESVLGYWTFSSVYLLTGLAGSSAAYIFGDAITVGASNCLFGLIGALAGYMWKNRAVQQSTDQLLSVAGIAIISFAMGSSDSTSVDNIGHIAGGLAGIYLGWSMGPKLKAKLPADGDSSQGPNTALVSLDTPASSKQGDAAPKQMDTVDVIGGVQRVSASVALLTALVGFTASVIIQRAGHLSLPRGLGLHL